jgi:hypothetical protein
VGRRLGGPESHSGCRGAEIYKLWILFGIRKIASTMERIYHSTEKLYKLTVYTKKEGSWHILDFIAKEDKRISDLKRTY